MGMGVIREGTPRARVYVWHQQSPEKKKVEKEEGLTTPPRLITSGA